MYRSSEPNNRPISTRYAPQLQLPIGLPVEILYDWHYKHYCYVQEPNDIRLLGSTQAAPAGTACKLNGLIDEPAETDAEPECCCTSNSHCSGSRKVAMHGGQAVSASKGTTQPSVEVHRNCVDAGSDVADVRDDLTYFDEMLTVLDGMVIIT